MNAVISLVLVIASIYAVSVSLTPNYYQNVSFLDGVDNVTDVDFGNVSILEDDNLQEEEEKADEKEHAIESEAWDKNR